jgi:hypothetical protein
VAAMADLEIIAIGISTIFSFEKSKEWNWRIVLYPCNIWFAQNIWFLFSYKYIILWRIIIVITQLSDRETCNLLIWYQKVAEIPQTLKFNFVSNVRYMLASETSQHIPMSNTCFRNQHLWLHTLRTFIS